MDSITTSTPGAERIITVATRPGVQFTFNTYDETGHTGTAVGTLSHETGMAELGNRGYAVNDIHGNRHYVSRYAFVVPLPDTTVTITETTEVIAGYVSNNDQTVRTPAGQFSVRQRNVGFADNDGKWVVSQYPELYWGTAGVLRERRPSRFLGVFDTPADVVAAIEAAEPTPEHTPYHKALN